MKIKNVTNLASFIFRWWGNSTFWDQGLGPGNSNISIAYNHRSIKIRPSGKIPPEFPTVFIKKLIIILKLKNKFCIFINWKICFNINVFQRFFAADLRNYFSITSALIAINFLLD